MIISLKVKSIPLQVGNIESETEAVLPPPAAPRLSTQAMAAADPSSFEGDGTLYGAWCGRSRTFWCSQNPYIVVMNVHVKRGQVVNCRR